MTWYDWAPTSPSTYVSFFHNFTSWVTWIIIAIVIIVIFWIIWAGQNPNFIGYKPLIPGTKPSDVMDQDTMTILGIEDPITPRIVPNISLNQDSSPDDEEIFIDLSQLTPEVNSKKHFVDNSLSSSNESSVVGEHPYGGFLPMVSSRQIRENRMNSDVRIYIPSPNKPTAGKTPRFKDLDLGTAQERKTAAESRGEKVCREFLEKYYQKKFPRIRPDFLVNPVSGRNLELDGYNSELNMGFEYNGYQHYTYPNRFHRTEEEFSQQIRRDGYKQEACRLAGVYLIIIPYTVPHAHIPQFINSRLPHKVHLLSSLR